MTVSELVKSIHRLVCVQNPYLRADQVHVTLKPHNPNSIECVAEMDSKTCHSYETADTCAWVAHTYYGKGRWGDVHGLGATPEEALRVLHDCVLAVGADGDKARAQVRAKALGALGASSGV